MNAGGVFRKKDSFTEALDLWNYGGYERVVIMPSDS